MNKIEHEVAGGLRTRYAMLAIACLLMIVGVVIYLVGADRPDDAVMAIICLVLACAGCWCTLLAAMADGMVERMKLMERLGGQKK